MATPISILTTINSPAFRTRGRLKSNRLWVALIAIVLSAGTARAAAPTTVHTLDLLTAELDGQRIFSMTVDDVTGLLGRPSATEDNRLLGNTVGPEIHYHHIGFSFWFDGKKPGLAQVPFLLKVFLTKSWDKKYSQFFEIFRGTITKSPNGNWRATDTQREFTDYPQKVRTPEDLQRELRAARVGSITSPLNHTVTISFGTHNVAFIHEATTRFLESLSLTR